MTRNVSRLFAIRLLTAWVLGFSMLNMSSGPALATYDVCTPPSGSGYSCSIDVSGDVAKPGKFSLHDIKKLIAKKTLAPTTQNVVFISGSGSTSGAWSGALLWDFLQYVGIQATGRQAVQKIIEVTATDGFVVRFGAGEISPNFGGHQVILTIYQDGNPLPDGNGFARLIFPGDKSGARNIFWISSIKVY
jgi:DMSO/TMAO reductase YedYZ molybdopterin-dependent catalytic subunit